MGDFIKLFIITLILAVMATPAVAMDLPEPSEAEKIMQSKCEALYKAARNNDVEKVKNLINDGCDLSRYSLLPRTIYDKDANAAKILIENGANANGYIREAGGHSRPLLIIALRDRQYEIAKQLIENGANVNAPDDDCHGGAAVALLFVAQDKYIDILTLLLKKGADVNGEDAYSNTALIKAAKSGQVKAIKLLIDNGADVNKKDGENKTALTYAKDKGHDEIVKILKEAGGT